MTATRWTDDTIITLIELWRRGLSAREIGEQIDKTRNAVIGKLSRLHKHLRPFTGRRPPPPPRPRVRHRPLMHSMPEEEVPIVVPEPTERKRMITLMELNGDTCRWPLNDGGPFLFCGDLKADGSPYCVKHTHAAYHPKPR
jgi:GcrA cell cycle regulator